MKIKQQKQIRAFLEEEFESGKSSALFDAQEKSLRTLIENTKGKSKNQMKTLTQTILPRIALYLALQKTGFSQEDVFRHMRKYMMDKVAAKKHSSTAKMELVPGFYAIYSRVFVPPICRKARRQPARTTLTSLSQSVSGIPPVWKTAVRSCAVCFATWMT